MNTRRRQVHITGIALAIGKLTRRNFRFISAHKAGAAQNDMP